MKKIYLLLLFVSIATVVTAQQAWTWINGKNTARTTASYGSPNKGSTSNNPGSRAQSVQWKDQQGNLWLFGGQTFGPTATTFVPPPMLLSDLWKYDIATGNWVWITGDTIPNQPGRYRASPNPGARRGAVSWTDPAGTFWLYGGYGFGTEKTYGYLSDLWQYTTAKGWLWMGGNTYVNAVGQYASINVQTGKNLPGGRSEMVGWADASGNLWMFGGYGYGDRDTGQLNDLWKYNTKIGEWTWVNGNGSVNQLSTYHARVNKPGGRSASTGWIDKSGMFWLFGGSGFDSKQKGLLSDVWQFDPNALEWNFAGGNETVEQPGVYGSQGVATAKNIPGGRMDALSWTDSNGDCWLFGGSGYGIAAGKNGYLADLWLFNTKTISWTWTKGLPDINVQGVYGKQGIADPANYPGSRGGAVCWVDKANLPWIFGGLGYAEKDAGYLNDLWHMNILQLPPKQSLTCPASKTLQNDTSCAVRVNGIDPILTGNVKTSYALTGASTASGSGSASGLSFNPGITKVVYKLVSDTSSCSFTVTVEDRKAPVPLADTLPDITGDCAITVKTRPKATDNCAGIVEGTTVDSLNYTNQGVYSIHWTFTDAYGNRSTQQQRVVLRAGTGVLTPLVAALPDVIAACSAVVTDIPMASKNCAGIFLATTTDPVSYSQQGAYIITWTFNDFNGTIIHQQQKVIIKDSTGPVPAQDTLPDIVADCAVTVKDIPKAKDNCAGTVTAVTNDPVNYAQPGSYSINWIYKDGNGNSATQQQRVFISAGSGPLKPLVASLPDLKAGCSLTITDFPRASGTCGNFVTATTSDPLIYNQQGVYNITWRYTDGNGNSSKQQQKIVIKDISAPVPQLASLPDINGKCSVTVTDRPIAFDDCSGKIIAVTKDPLIYNRQGVYTINWEFNDGNGNVNLQQQKVILKIPVALAPGPIVLPDIISECAFTVTSKPTIQDYCLGTVTAFTTDSLSYTQPGTYTINWKFITGSGDTIIQKQPIIVKKLSLTVNAWPNPASNYFTVTIKTCNHTDKISLRVFDLLGRIIENRTVQPFETIMLGAHYSNAEYFIQVLQGKERLTQKILKMK